MSTINISPSICTIWLDRRAAAMLSAQSLSVMLAGLKESTLLYELINNPVKPIAVIKAYLSIPVFISIILALGVIQDRLHLLRRNHI